ncbi:MAG: hypothetical protein ACMUIU_02215 [bacterium]
MRYTKSLLFTVFVVAVIGMVIVSTSNVTMAKVGDNVTAVCSVCHTMHHSQDGVDPFISFDPNRDVSTGPNNALLFGVAADPNENNNSCVACHSGSSSVTNGYDTVTGAPQIDLTGDDILAGGTYAGTTDAVRHNALGLAPPDAKLGTPNVPPGGSNDDIGGADQITCAGTTGCHGNRAETDNLAAVYGAHHGEDKPLDGSAVGKSYRFLSTDKVDEVFSNSGVLGLEHLKWESGRYNTKSQITASDSSEHNVYDADGINKLCASCHGNFHGDAGQGGPSEPWLRHPTDITLEAAAASGPGEYTAYPEEGDLVNKYSTEAPVGYDASAGNNQIGTNVAKIQGQVLCVSCHRAHGAESWDDILRWDYDEIVAGSDVNTGCNRCHTTK